MSGILICSGADTYISVTACRSGATGKVVYSDFGLSSTVATREDIEKVIDGFACAFHLI